MNEYGALVQQYWQEKTEVLRGKPVAMPVYLPQIPHELASWWDVGT